MPQTSYLIIPSQRPETGLIQKDCNPLEADIPDPHHDLQIPVVRSPDTELPSRPNSTPLSLTLSNLLPHTPKIFKGSASSECEYWEEEESVCVMVIMGKMRDP